MECHSRVLNAAQVGSIDQNLGMSGARTYTDRRIEVKVYFEDAVCTALKRIKRTFHRVPVF